MTTALTTLIGGHYIRHLKPHLHTGASGPHPLSSMPGALSSGSRVIMAIQASSNFWGRMICHWNQRTPKAEPGFLSSRTRACVLVLLEPSLTTLPLGSIVCDSIPGNQSPVHTVAVV